MDAPDFAALATLAAGFLDLSIEPSMLDGVAGNLALLYQHAGRVMVFALPDSEEIAPVFAA